MNDTFRDIIAMMIGTLQQEVDALHKAREVEDEFSAVFFDEALHSHIHFANKILKPFGYRLTLDHWKIKHEEI